MFLIDKSNPLNYNDCGDNVNPKNIEQFYDYYDGTADILYRNYKVPYLEGMNEAFRFLLDDKMNGTYSVEDTQKIQKLKSDIIHIGFTKEEIRKSVQIGILKGYKHTRSPNSLITPETIGIFVAYLIKKFTFGIPLNSILDPLVGSGNLLYTVANNLGQNIKLYGIDNDITKCELSRNIGDLLEYENQVFYQDTLSFYNNGFECLIMDMPIMNQEDDYLPYKVLNHHIDSVIDGGFVFALIENDFFEQPKSDIFRMEIIKKAQIIGLIKLPEELFKSHHKSILILKKHKNLMKQLDHFLMVDLPSFRDQESMQRILLQIDQWIEIRKDDLK